MTVRATARKALYLTSIVLILLFTYFFFTPIDLTGQKNLIIPPIENVIHANIEVTSLVLTILPYPRLSLKGLILKESGSPVLKAESVNASLAMIRLFLKREFEVKNLLIVKPELFMRREADGGLNIIRILSETFIPVSIKKVRVKKGRAYFVDDFLKEKVRYEAADIDATLIPRGARDFSYSGTIKLFPSAKIKFSGQTKDMAQDFEGIVDITGLNIGQIWPYLNVIIPGERPDVAVGASLSYNISIKDSFTIFVPKAEIHLPEFTTTANLEFITSKDSDGKLALKLNTTPIPLSSIKRQFFISILPDILQQEINLLSFANGEIKISDLKLAGNMRELRRPSYYKTRGSLQAVIEIKNAGFARRGFNLYFSTVNGTVQWHDGNLTMQGINGRYGRTVVERLDGSMEQILSAPFIKFKGHSVLDAGEMASELNNWVSEETLLREGAKGLAADGSVSLSFDISGGLELSDKNQGKGLALSIVADAASANIGYASWFKKGKGFNMAVDTSLLIKRDSISIDKAKINFGASAFDIKGFLNHREGLSYKLDITASDVRLNDIDGIIPYLKKESASNGSLSADLSMDKVDKQRSVKVKGIAYLRDGEFETRMFPKKISDANLSARFYGNSGVITVDGIKIGSSTFSGTVNIPDITAANINFNLTSSYIDDEDIYRYDENGEEIDIPFTGKGRLSAKDAKVRGFHIESLETDVLLKSDALLFKTVFISNNGKVLGNFIYSTNKEDDFLWRMNLDASKVELEPLIKEMGAGEKVLSGDADGKIEMVARKGEGMLSKRIDGKGEVSSKNGRLWKFVVFSKIFSIVNIVSIDELFREGLPYKTLAGNFVIKDGIMSTENLLLNSNSMRMSAIGIIDVPNMAIDAKLGLHPFVTVDKIITKIPLAGWIIGGKEKSIVSMYYTIKGPLNNPDVEAIPIQALGEGVWGIFKRILKLPVDVVEPLVK
ncbi:MAG TPA: hypothetical protein DD725_05380 [Deltaproteobacteria bacterium]|nr:hypothetical protein [Deltaproteobacteria bacterium]